MTQIVNPFALNTTYNFDTRAPALLGASKRGLKVKGIFDHEQASLYGEMAVKHAAIYPYLPIGTPKDYTKYTYLLFVSEAGDKQVMALEWINLDTVQVVSIRNLRITVSDVSPGDELAIRQSLAALNFSKFSIEEYQE
jgi:hypothetical protein